MKNTVLTFILFLLCAIIFSGCTIWDVEELREKSRPKSKDKDAAYTVTVTFNSNGGSAIANQYVAFGGRAIRPANPTRSGFVFGAWYKDAAFTALYNFSEAVNSNITLYARWFEVTISNVGIELISIPAGTFTMGSVSGGNSNERPVRQVTISAFKMGRYEVTQEQYRVLMNNNPSNFSSNPAAEENQSRRPVESVSWYDAVEFCNWLSEKEGFDPFYNIDKSRSDPNNTGLYDNVKWLVTTNESANGYRLPTEAEWEYACRAGTATDWHFGNNESELDDYAWYWDNSNSMTHEVGKKTANAWGLHDMHGNVYEWCWDWDGTYESGNTNNPVGPTSGTNRVLRGGSWTDSAGYARSAYRNSIFPNWFYNDLGFRVVRSDDGNTPPHAHTYSTTWSSNAVHHWKECTFAGCDDRTEFADHTPPNGVCTICGFNNTPVNMEMVQIPAGTLTWSSATITISAFKMGKFEVTQEQYQAVMGVNPSYFSSDPETGETQSKRPVERVSWYDAVVFCNKLSIGEGLTPAYQINGSTNPDSWGTVPEYNSPIWDAVTIVASSTGYRLPTEAQWEYACRAGTATDWHFGNNESELDDYAWYWDNSNSKTHEVGKKTANAWGLHDMHGNVWEWCWDWYDTLPASNQIDYKGADSGTYRVLRGGGWGDSAGHTRSAARYGIFPDFRYFDSGFRVVRP